MCTILQWIVGVLYASAWEDSKLPVHTGVCSPKKATNCWGNDGAQTIHNTECGKSSWLLLLSAGLPKVGFADASIGVEQSTENPTQSMRNIRFDCIVAALAIYAEMPFWPCKMVHLPKTAIL